MSRLTAKEREESSLPPSYRRIAWFLVLIFLRYRIALWSTIFAITAATFWSLTPQDWAASQVRLLELERDRLQAKVSNVREDEGRIPENGADMDTFVSTLPIVRDTAMLATLYDTARRRGLSWTEAKYSESPLIGGRVMRLDIEIPVSGSYAAVRGFLADSMNAQQHMALRHLVLRRAKDGAGVEAELKFSVFYRPK